MRPDPYAGTDLLADVFPGTEDAQLPDGGLAPGDGGGGVPWFRPHPEDTRWKPRPRRALSRAEVAEYAAEDRKITELRRKPPLGRPGSRSGRSTG
jgi:hypothetical protein